MIVDVRCYIQFITEMILFRLTNSNAILNSSTKIFDCYVDGESRSCAAVEPAMTHRFTKVSPSFISRHSLWDAVSRMSSLPVNRVAQSARSSERELSIAKDLIDSEDLNHLLFFFLRNCICCILRTFLGEMFLPFDGNSDIYLPHNRMAIDRTERLSIEHNSISFQTNHDMS